MSKARGGLKGGAFGFDSIAQLVEQVTLNLRVVGSNPTGITPLMSGGEMAYKDKNDPRRKEAERRWNQKNRAEANRKKRNELRAFMKAYKETVGCEDCGKTFPSYVLDLDHRSGTEKVVNPAALIMKGSWQMMIAEIMKCDVVCANCHRERTFRRSNGELI